VFNLPLVQVFKIVLKPFVNTFVISLEPSIMKDDHKDILMSKRCVLVANMHLSDALLNDLISEKILKIEEKDTIRRNDATENEKVNILTQVRLIGSSGTIMINDSTVFILGLILGSI